MNNPTLAQSKTPPTPKAKAKRKSPTMSAESRALMEEVSALALATGTSAVALASDTGVSKDTCVKLLTGKILYVKESTATKLQRWIRYNEWRVSLKESVSSEDTRPDAEVQFAGHHRAPECPVEPTQEHTEFPRINERLDRQWKRINELEKRHLAQQRDNDTMRGELDQIKLDLSEAHRTILSLVRKVLL